MRLRVPTIVLVLVSLTACLSERRPKIQDKRYREVSLADITTSPGDFDQALVRVRGNCQVEFEAIWRTGFETAAFIPNYETRTDALEQLEFKTGWIHLGLLTDDDDWAITPAFQLVAPTGRERVLPERGDEIRLTERVRVHILDYATDGEQQRLESPMARGSREQSSETRLWLPNNAVVRVEALDELRAGKLRLVWARIVPVAQR